MLAELSIRGFRCFSNLRLEGLRRINLISGRNSTGKSSVLEAAQFFHQPDPHTLRDLLEWRGQLFTSRQGAVWTEETVRPLFSAAGGDGAPRFELSSGDSRIVCRIAHHVLTPAGDWVEASTVSNGAPRIPVLRVESSAGSAPGPFFYLPLNGSARIDEMPEGAMRGAQAFLRYVKPEAKRVIHARAGSFSGETLSGMLEHLLGAERLEDVMRVLRWVVPGARFAFTKGQGEGRSIHVQADGFDVAQPLASFGDGAVRLVGISLAVILAQGGACLLDEIENGVHYSLFREMWPLLDRLSRELQVQIFATTHSKDCLEAFEEASAHRDFDAAYYRMEREPGGLIEAVRLDYASYFARVADLPHEVR